MNNDRYTKYFIKRCIINTLNEKDDVLDRFTAGMAFEYILSQCYRHENFSKLKKSQREIFFLLVFESLGE